MSYIGYLAAFCTTFAYFPQAIKAIKTKDVSGISLVTFSILCLGIALWSLYGVILRDAPLAIANFVTLIPAIAILYIKVKSVQKP